MKPKFAIGAALQASGAVAMRLLLLIISLIFTGASAMAADGLTTIASDLSPAEAVSRLEVEIKNRNLTIFARIDHAAGAQAVGLPLRPTEVIIFGNARGGTPLMQDQQTIGIDLPLKILVWQDEAGRTWLSYNDPQWLARRHGLEPSSDKTAQALSQTLGAIARAAAPVSTK